MRKLLLALAFLAPCATLGAVETVAPRLAAQIGAVLPAVTLGPGAAIADRLAQMPGLSQIDHALDFSGAHAFTVLSPLVSRIMEMRYEGVPVTAESFAALPEGVKAELVGRAAADEAVHVERRAKALVAEFGRKNLDGKRVAQNADEAGHLVYFSQYFISDSSLRGSLSQAYEGFAAQARADRGGAGLSDAQRQLRRLMKDGSTGGDDEDWPKAAAESPRHRAARAALHEAGQQIGAILAAGQTGGFRREWESLLGSVSALESRDFDEEPPELREVIAGAARRVRMLTAALEADRQMDPSERQKRAADAKRVVMLLASAKSELEAPPASGGRALSGEWLAKVYGLMAGMTQQAEKSGNAAALQDWQRALAVFAAVQDRGAEATPEMAAEVNDMVRPLVREYLESHGGAKAPLARPAYELTLLLARLSAPGPR